MSMYRLLKFNREFGFPTDSRLYYRCALCGGYVPSAPDASARCECGNVAVDVPSHTLSEKQRNTAALVRKIA
jgi:hypothetical protein